MMAIERLTGEDRLMLDAGARWPQDIGALALLDGTGLFDASGRFRIEAVRDAIGARLHVVPRLRRRHLLPARGRGGPLWVDDAGFDLAAHIREVRLEPPAAEPELLAAVERLRRTPLDLSRSPWEMWFLTGLPRDRVALLVKVHHTVADGLATMTLVTALMERSPLQPTPSPPAWAPARPPRDSELVADNLVRRLRGVGRALAALARPWASVRAMVEGWPATYELLGEAASTRTSVDRVIGMDRNLELVRASHRVVRRIARTCDASPNDVLLAVTAAGLRALLLSRGEPVEGTTLRVYVPVSLRRRLRGPQHGTLIAQMAVPLDLGAAAPAERLRRIAVETAHRKARRRIRLGKLFRGRLLSGLLLMAVIRQRVNVTTASIPGPKQPRYLAGARVLEVFPILPLVGNQPLGVGAVSYERGFGIGITADRDTFPDLPVFATAVRDELQALEALVVPRAGAAVGRVAAVGAT